MAGRASCFRSGYLGAFLVFALANSSSAAAFEWTPASMIRFRTIGDTAVCPDGLRVAYTVSEPVFGKDRSFYRTHVRMAAADGSDDRRMTFGDASCRNPLFSPDGGLLAFTSARKTGATQVWVMLTDGGEAWRATDAESGVSDYSWSPDGGAIAYITRDPREPQKDAAPDVDDTQADVEIRGAHPRFAHIHIVPLAGPDGEIPPSRRLTEGSFHVSSFDWSPDGNAIVFAHRVSPSPDVWSTTDISIVTLDTGEVTPLVSRPGADRYPRFSPDGSMIAFPSDAADPHWALLSDAYVVPVDGGEPRALVETPDRNFMYYGRFLGWSADGSRLFVREADGVSWRVYAIPVDGGSPVPFTTGPGNFTDVSFSRDGSVMAFVHERTNMFPDVWITGTGDFSPRRLTRINPEAPPPGSFAPTETISWRSRDGRTIEGLLTYPANHAADRKYPLLLYIHGGPANVHTEQCTGAPDKYPIQAFASRGYAVLRVNPRGSSGYGREFRYANIDDWGFGDFEDQMAGVETVIRMGVAHPDSLCVSGWSYGGFMTAMTVTRTGRFRAAVMGAGIADLASFTGTADIPSFIPDYFKGEPWERKESYIRHSPVFHAGEVTTPTLILHGENDRRVPLSQGEEFHNALTRNGVPTELVVYPRTYHSPSEPALIRDVGERIIDWCDRYLGRK